MMKSANAEMMRTNARITRISLMTFASLQRILRDLYFSRSNSVTLFAKTFSMGYISRTITVTFFYETSMKVFFHHAKFEGKKEKKKKSTWKTFLPANVLRGDFIRSK